VRHPVVVGLQFGDEGKGKVTDFLAAQADWVIRFNGGANAGHTLHYQGKKVVTHCIPSGILYPDCKNYIGNGCVLNVDSLVKEKKLIEEAGFSCDDSKLKIDYRVHLTLPVQLAIEAERENGKNKLGSTMRGIGDTYASKSRRIGIRVGDLFSDNLEEKIKDLCNFLNPIVLNEQSSFQLNLKAALEAKKTISSHVVFEPSFFYNESKKKKCLLEGAQAVLLDIDHGFYPFVTSSNTVAGAAATGGPFPVSRLGTVYGVSKAYLTRVGEGPFDSEITDEFAEVLRKKGGEYGATTARPRKVGWLNLDELKIACEITDCHKIVLTKADILCEEKVKIYLNGKLHDMKSWDKLVDKNGNIDSNFQDYISFIEKNTGITIGAFGTGPSRDDIVWINKPNDFWD